MSLQTYYGDERLRAVTYLEFGEINLERGTKAIWEFQLHQRAYDWLMLGRYANDMLAYSDMTKAIDSTTDASVFDIYNREVHHADDASTNLSKLIAVTVGKAGARRPSFYELGQTLFGCIEGMGFCLELLRAKSIEFPDVDLKHVRWYGVDISEMFNRLAVMLHRDFQITTVTDPALLPDQMDVFFSKGISLLYAVRDTEHFFETVGKGRCAIFDYSLSFAGSEDTTIGSGKTVRYLPVREFMREYGSKDHVMFVNRVNSRYVAETDRIWLDCVYGVDDVCTTYIEMHKRIYGKLLEQFASVNEATRFLNGRKPPVWVSCEEFVAESAKERAQRLHE